jgi:hypothetical protein
MRATTSKVGNSSGMSGGIHNPRPGNGEAASREKKPRPPAPSAQPGLDSPDFRRFGLTCLGARVVKGVREGAQVVTSSAAVERQRMQRLHACESR